MVHFNANCIHSERKSCIGFLVVYFTMLFQWLDYIASMIGWYVNDDEFYRIWKEAVVA
jgi:hypothetical protein